MSDKDDILIIEDSPAISMVLKSYSEKLGYVRIHNCDTGTTAIATFNDLISQNKQPIVLLDYMLPDHRFQNRCRQEHDHSTQSCSMNLVQFAKFPDSLIERQDWLVRSIGHNIWPKLLQGLTGC